MSVEHTAPIFSTDELYWTGDVSDSPTIDVPQLDMRIAPSSQGTSEQSPILRFINDRFNRIHRLGWRMHVPSEVAKTQSVYDTLAKNNQLNDAVHQEMQNLVLAKVGEAWRDRQARVIKMAEYIGTHPILAVLTDYGTGEGGVSEQRRFAAPVVDFVVMRGGSAMIIEPIVKSATSDTYGRLPRKVLAKEAYTPTDD